MAKEDFCFTYYDGDAARDVAHMTRLCRGAYHDLVIMQRKVGPMTMGQIKMVLSSDFDTCWPLIEFILKTTDDQKYFIEWVEKSVKKSREHSEKQAEKIKQYWEDVKNGKILRNKKSIPQYKNKSDLDIPLEDGNGYGYKDDLKGGTGENFNTMPKPEDCGGLPEITANSVIELIRITKGKSVTANQVKGLWPVFLAQHATGKKYYQNVEAVYSHFINWIRTQNFENGKSITDKGAERLDAMRNYAKR